MRCVRCGHELVSSARFCGECGAASVVSMVPNSLAASNASQKRARDVVLAICIITFIVACCVLKPLPIFLTLLFLIIFYFGWDSPHVKSKAKLVACMISLGAILGTQLIEITLIEHERIRQLENAERQKTHEEAAKRMEDEAANAAFTKLTSSEHLNEARRLLRPGGNPTDIALGKRHLAAVDSNGAAAAHQIEDQFEIAQKAADQAAAKQAAVEAKRDAAAQDALNEALRIDAAKNIENKMLDEGMNVDVQAVGPKHTTLRLKYIFVSKVFAHKLSEDGEMFDSLRKVGFKKLIATDGYDEEWTWTL